MIAGALGDGMLTWLSSWPFEVLTKIRFAVADRRRVRHVVLQDAELVHHVVAPDDVDVGLARQLSRPSPDRRSLPSRKPSMSTAISSPRFDM